MTGDPITLVNRTDEKLKFTADGRHYELAPGDNHGYVEAHAFFALKQNPVMGTEDYATVTSIYKVGVKKGGVEMPEYPCDPLPAEVLLAGMDARERFDRRTTPRQNVEERKALGAVNNIRAAMPATLGLGNN